MKKIVLISIIILITSFVNVEATEDLTCKEIDTSISQSQIDALKDKDNSLELHTNNVNNKLSKFNKIFETLDTCSSLDGWNTDHCLLSIANDNLLITGDTVDTPSLVSKYFEVTDSIFPLEINFEVNEYDNCFMLQIQLVNEDFSKTFKADTTAIMIGQNSLRLSKADFTTENGADWDTDTFTFIAFAMYPQPEKTPKYTLMNINQATDVPTATFTFDTDYSCLIDTVKPVLDEKGYKATEFITPLTVGMDGHLTLEQIHELRDAGWSHGHQGYNHIDAFTVTQQQLEEDYKLGIKWLIDNGLPNAQFHLAYGKGHYNADTDAICKKLGITYGRTVASGNNVAGVNNLHIATCLVINTTTIDDINRAIDSAYDNGTNVTFMIHNVIEGASGEGEITPAFFQQIVDAVYAKGLKVVTVAEYMEAVEKNK